MLMHSMSVGTSLFSFSLEFSHFTSTSFFVPMKYDIFLDLETKGFSFSVEEGTARLQRAFPHIAALTEGSSLCSHCQCEELGKSWGVS